MAAVDFPNSPTTNQVFTSGSLQYVYDGAKWASGLLTGFAPITNVAGGTQNYAPIAAPTFSGTTTAATLAVTGTTTMTGNAAVTTQLSVGGAGSGALYYKGSLIESQFAPITNPTSGTANYAPIASPTFTGTVTLPTVALPDTSAWTSNGLVFNPGAASPLNSRLLFGTGTTYVAAITASPANGFQASGGSHQSANTWVADGTAASIINVTPASISFYTNTGLTAGNTYTPTQLAVFVPSVASFNVPIQSVGFTNGSNAAAGQVGEYLASNGSVALTNGTWVTVVGLSLTAGDWDVWGLATFIPNAGGALSYVYFGVGPTLNAQPSAMGSLNGPTMGAFAAHCPTMRVNITATTTYYVNMDSGWSTATSCTGNANIYARRMR